MVSGIGPWELFWWLLLVAVFLFVQGVGDANRWSFQPFYKRRLQSAFTLQRTCTDGVPAAQEVPFQVPLPFMNLLDAPALVVGAAVNLEEYGLLPPGRPVSSFTFSRERVDAGILGAVPPGCSPPCSVPSSGGTSPSPPPRRRRAPPSRRSWGR